MVVLLVKEILIHQWQQGMNVVEVNLKKGSLVCPGGQNIYPDSFQIRQESAGYLRFLVRLRSCFDDTRSMGPYLRRIWPLVSLLNPLADRRWAGR